MKYQKVFVACCMMIFLCAGIAFAQAEKVAPEQKISAHQIIRLNPIAGLNPKEVTIKAGTTVIWFNESGSLAEVQFTDKQVTLACKSPTHFAVDEQGSYISDKIPRGAVASLCFVQKGTYNYVVRREPRTGAQVPVAPPELKGTITVE